MAGNLSYVYNCLICAITEGAISCSVYVKVCWFKIKWVSIMDLIE